jgi:hypothetical protein
VRNDRFVRGLHQLRLESRVRVRSNPFMDTRTIQITLATLCIAACSGSFSAGKPTDSSALQGKPTSEHHGTSTSDAATSDGDRDGTVPVSESKDHTTPTTTIASPPSGTDANEGDCIKGEAKGHTKDKAQGEAKGHDKPPCPDEPADAKGAAPAKPSEKATDKSADKPADKASPKATDATKKK